MSGPQASQSARLNNYIDIVSCIAEIGISLSIGKFCSGVGNPRCSEKIRDIIQKDIIDATQ